MSMTELNHMAKEMGIENFGTCASMRSFSISCRRMPTVAGALFRGVLEVLSEGSVSSVPKLQLPALPGRHYVSLPKSGALTSRRAI